MTLADSLSFVNERNYTIVSFAIGFVIGLIPSLGVLGPIAGGFLYAYFARRYGVIAGKPFEGAKKGAAMGVALAVVGLLLTVLLWGGFWAAAMPVMGPFYTVSGLILVGALISALIVGAILGGTGGLLSVYVE
ncbi:MAG: hypothetical protein QI223_01750 [Candidatus Korarchaeota archaeon]|nr:hypothetical protein [Candidatus Korarchaeota archaeon]